MRTAPKSPPKWWKEGIGYQIWPASYKDSNNDGVGDIPGIISTLDHLSSLGVTYIWLSPMYASPQNDMGYDISDYEDVYFKYGTLEDMDRLIDEVHRRGMRLILDLVVNHTSSEHRWFKESRKGKGEDNEFKDWYIWRDPKYVDTDDTGDKEKGKEGAGGVGRTRNPPNNWCAAFTEDAWTYVPERDQYYLHLFHDTMPDLNWHNEATRKGVHESAIEFWLKRGIDGFRVDVVNFYDKDQNFPDAEVAVPGARTQRPNPKHVIDGPNMHKWLKEIRTEAMDKYGHDLVMVGELWGTERDEVLRYISAKERELDIVFDFGVFGIGGEDTPENKGRNKEFHDYLVGYKLSELKTAVMTTQGFLTDLKITDAWPTVFLENHDVPRSVSRYGSTKAEFGERSAKVLATLMCTLSGTVFLYQGQEIGMTNIPSSWTAEDLCDVSSLNYLKKMERQYPNDEAWRKKAMAGIRKMARDNARTPVQWSSKGEYAGFTANDSQPPWMRVNENFKSGVNVEDQNHDPNSVLEFWKKAIKLRKELVALLVYGTTEMLDHANENVMTFLKWESDSVGGDDKGGDTSTLGQVILVSLNFSETEQPTFVPEGWSDAASGTTTLLLSTHDDGQDTDDKSINVALGPWEGRVYMLNRGDASGPA